MTSDVGLFVSHLRNSPVSLASAFASPHDERMTNRPARSLKYEYELFVDEEIENYKESVPRSALLSIGDEAVAALSEQAQFALTELLLVQEVDRIIFRRLRLPSYGTWRRRRVKLLSEMRRPEHWGLQPDDVVVRAVRPTGEARVLVAGAAEAPALYFAANGCEVTAVANDGDVIERVLAAAAAAGLGERVHAHRAEWVDWSPESELDAVIVTSAALRGLTSAQRARVFRLLQGATAHGGIHLVEADAQRTVPTLRELESRYEGWSVSLERDGSSEMLLARKEIPS
jgi:hypothetical protein